MSVDPITAGLNLAEVLVKRIWPDPAKQAEEMFKLTKLAQDGDVAALNAEVNMMQGQLAVNKAEAESGNWFIAGWRPCIGWVGALSMAYQFLICPLLMWATSGLDGYTPPPALDTTALYPIVTAMLGIGGMRSYDKIKGTHTRKVGKK